MTITINSPFHCGTQISEDNFVAEIRRRGALTANNPVWRGLDPEQGARRAYRLITAYPDESAEVWLAIPQHEHTWGKNASSVLHRCDTASVTNARSVRVKRLRRVDAAPEPPMAGTYQIVRDPVRRSDYARYANALDSFEDGIERIRDPQYAYAKARTIIEVIRIFAPGSDQNRPEEYAQAVADDINATRARYAGQGQEPPMADGRDSRFQWVPDTSEYGYPQGTRGRNGYDVELGIVHITVGNDSLAWLNGNNGSSAHLLTDKAMRPRAQMVSFLDAAWTAGHREYNLRGINVEAEMPGNLWTKVLITAFAETTLPVWKAHNIPLVYLGKDNGPGKRGIIGHSDVPDPDGSGWGGNGNHTDPGSTFIWDFYISELRRLDSAQPEPAPDILILPGQGSESPDIYPPNVGLERGFKGTYLALGAVKFPNDPPLGILTLLGWAKGAEFEAVDGCVYQRFQRATLQYNPRNAQPWDIVQMHPETDVPARKDAA